MDYKTPLVTSLAYILYSLKTNQALKNVMPRPKPIMSILTFVMVLHNIILTGFSFTVLIYTAPIVFNFYTTNSFLTAIKDPQKVLQSKIEFWIWIFYVSKIYEIVDSLILHWNKRPTSFLQMYHHAGAIICCWMLSACDTHLPWIFVCINSFIHTMMYFYYLLTTLKLKVPKFYKRIITRMQIIQFVSGASLVILHVLIGSNFSKDYNLRMFQYATLCANIGYVTILFFLFKNFERQTYKKEKQN